MNEDEFTNAEPDFDIPPLHIRIFHTIILRFVVLFIVTLVFSAVNQVFVTFFSAEVSKNVFMLFNCIITILYFVFLYRFADKSEFMAISPAEYFISVSVVCLSYSAVCISAYFLANKTLYSWVFRMSVSFAAILGVSGYEKMLPYIIAFQGFSFLIVLAEPLIERIIYRRNARYFGE